MIKPMRAIFSSTPSHINFDKSDSLHHPLHHLGIGHDKNLLYKDKEDMRLFKNLTKGNVVVVGQRTFDTIPNGLPARVVLVCRSGENRTNGEFKKICENIYTAEEGVFELTFDELGLLITNPHYYSTKTWWCIGGAVVFNHCLRYINRLRIHEFRELPVEEPNVWIDVPNSMTRQSIRNDPKLNFRKIDYILPYYKFLDRAAWSIGVETLYWLEEMMMHDICEATRIEKRNLEDHICGEGTRYYGVYNRLKKKFLNT